MAIDELDVLNSSLEGVETTLETQTYDTAHDDERLRTLTTQSQLNETMRKMVKVLVIFIVILLLILLGVFAYKRINQRLHPSNKEAVSQSVDPKEEIVGSRLKKRGTLTVNGNLQVNGPIQISDSNGSNVILQPSTNSASTTLVLPNQSGTLCLSNNNCNFTTKQDLKDGIAAIVVPPSSFVNGYDGVVNLQGTADQVTVLNGPDGRISLSLAQSLGTRNSPTFAGLLLSGGLTANGPSNFKGTLTQNGYTVCTIAGNCSSAMGLTGSGTIGTLAYFTASGELGSSLLKQAASTVTVSGDLSVTGDVTAANFRGNGSNLTNLNVANCTDCVQLQHGASQVAQNGDISISGTTSTNALYSAQLVVRPTVNASGVVNFQDASGSSILNVDTATRNITVSDLLPRQSGNTIAGFDAPLTLKGPVNTYNDNSKWSVVGSDGFMRFTYIDWNDDTAHFVRCYDNSCSNKTDTIIETDRENTFDSPTIALDHAGNAYVAYITYTSPVEWHIAHCADQDCSSTTIQAIPTLLASSSYNGSITVDGSNHAALVFDSYVNSPPWHRSFDLIYCQDVSCATYSTTNINATTDNSGAYFETSAISTGSDGLLRIGYVDGSSQTLQYVRCINADCSNRVANTVPGSDGADYYFGMTIGSDNKPRFALDTGAASIGYIYCNDSDCATSIAKTIPLLDSYGWRYLDISLLPGDIPIIGTFTEANSIEKKIVSIYCGDTLCSTPIVTGYDKQNNVYMLNIAIGGDGLPQIVYDGKEGVSEEAIKFIHANTVDGRNIQTQGTSIGSATEQFGQIYSQGLALQGSSHTALLSVNQIASDGETGSGSLADFAINGTSRIKIDADGTLIATPERLSSGIIVKAAVGQYSDLQQWQSSLGTVLGGVNAQGQIYTSATTQVGVTMGSLLLGSADNSGQMLGVKRDDGTYKLGISGTGAVNIGGQYTPSPLVITASINEGLVGSLIVVDFNGDGKIDRAGLRNDDKIGVQLGQGGGSFAANKTYSFAGGHKYSRSYSKEGGLFAIDATSDGILDLVNTKDYVGAGCNYPTSDFTLYISVWPGNGDGSFGVPILTQVSNNLNVWPQCYYSSGSSASGDVNGDGLVDIMMSVDGSSSSRTVFINNGDGTFTQGNTVYLNSGEVYLIDVNGDGNNDLINNSPFEVNFAYGNGDGTFSTISSNRDGSFYGGYDPSRPIVVDIDNDGDLDVVDSLVGYSFEGGILTYSTKIRVARSNGSGGYTIDVYKVWSGTEYGIGGYNMELVNLNSDGNLDAVVVGSYYTQFIPGANNGTFGIPTEPIKLAGGRNTNTLGLTVVSDWLGNGTKQVGYLDGSGYFNVISYLGSAGLQVKSIDTNALAAPTAILQKNSSSSTGNLLELKDEKSNVLSKFDSSGNLTVNGSISTGTVTVNTQLNTSSISSTGAGINGTGNGLTAKWYNNCTTAGPACGQPLTATATTGPIDKLTFGQGELNCPSALPAGVNCTNVAASITGFVKADYTDTYTFYCYSDDGCRVWVNGTQIINRWTGGQAEASGNISLTAGNWYSITIEYYQATTGANLSLRWSNNLIIKQTIPANKLSTTAPGTINLNNDSGFAGKLQDTAGTGTYLSLSPSSSNSGATILNTRKGANIGLQIQGSYNQTANLLNIVDLNGNINASFSSTGAVLTLGRVAASGTVTKGQIKLSDGTTDNRSLTIQTAPLSTNAVVTIPATGAADTFCMVVLANCAGGGGGGGGGIGGSGTLNYVARFIGASTIGTGALYDDGTAVGINTTNFGSVNKLSINTNITTDNNAVVQLNTGSDLNKALVVQASAGQLANIAEFQSNNGTALVYVGPSGELSVQSTINSGSGFISNGTVGATVSCSSDQLLKGIVIKGGIVTGGSCTTGVSSSDTYDGSSSSGVIVVSGSTHNGGSSGVMVVGSGSVGGAGNLSGNVVIDVGAATNGATAGTISLGASNATGILIGNAGAALQVVSNTINISALGDISGVNSLSVANNNFQVDASGFVKYASGVADTNDVVCRNSFGQLAGCANNAILQGGNSLGEDLTIGTKDYYGVNFIANNATVAAIGPTGQTVFKNSTNSSTAFRVQNASGSSLLTVDTASNKLYVGVIGGDEAGTLLVVGSKTTAGDPAGVNGAMYYSTVLGRFRCYENNSWANCTSKSNDVATSADQTFSATSYSSVNDINYAVEANHMYQLRCTFITSVSGNGGNISMTGPMGISRYVATFQKTSDQSSGDTFVTSTAYDDPSSATSFRIETSVTGTKMFMMEYKASLVTGATPGVWQLRAKAASASSSITLYSGSNCNMVMLK